MAVRIGIFGGGARLSGPEIELIARGVATHGRTTLLAPSLRARDSFRRSLADAGAGVGIDVQTPANWLAGLWELFGDGRRLVTPLVRALLVSDVLAGCEPDEIAPLRANPGTVRLLASIAADLLPYLFGDALDGGAPDGGTAGLSPEGGAAGAEDVLRRLLAGYAERLAALGLAEPSQAAEELRRSFVNPPAPACTGFIALRDVDKLPAFQLGLLAACAREGEVRWLLDDERAPFAEGIERAFGQIGCRVERADQPDAGRAGGGPDGGASGSAPDAPRARASISDLVTEALPTFVEAAGPHARDLAYAREIVRLAGEARGGAASGADGSASGADVAAGPLVVVVSARPGELFESLAPRLAAQGLAASSDLSARFDQTMAGQQIASLADLAARMRAAREGEAEAISWWPAPELADWLASPLSGAGAFEARRFDKKLRSTRSLTVDAVLSQLQSVQGRVAAARAKLDAGNPFAQVPCVCADVFNFLMQGRPVSALKAMLSVARALPASALGSTDGSARIRMEQAVLTRALEIVGPTAHGLGVSQDVAMGALSGLKASIRVEAGTRAQVDEAVEDGAVPPTAPRTHVAFMSAEDAACLASGSVDAVLCADVDIESYPLAHEEGPRVILAEQLHREPLEVEPMAHLRALFRRILVLPASAAARPDADGAAVGDLPAPVFARVSHDRQAKDRYPAAIWTELKAVQDARVLERLRAEARAAGAIEKEIERVEVPKSRSVGEGDIVADLDMRAGEGMRSERVTCLAPLDFSPEAVSYLVLRERDPRRAGDPDAPLVPRRLSASQIESYLTCPLCWFVSNRIRPQQIDAGFGGMEKGNFVHDVLYRFHATLAECGIPRVTRENLEQCLPVLSEVFETVREEHERGKTSSSGPLVPLSAAERLQVDGILPQLERVVRFEASAFSPFAPTYLEYSFDGLGIDYAGRPLGGRIDRVDIDAEGRAVVIDYKHRAGATQFNVKDPTAVGKDGAVPADDPDWLPAHTQTLIYAQALRRSDLGLDPRGAVYLFTKGGRPALHGAVSEELAEQEPGDGRAPGLRSGFPDIDAGGTMGFDELLDRVEQTVGRRLDELEAGVIRPAGKGLGGCAFNHDLGFERRDA